MKKFTTSDSFWQFLAFYYCPIPDQFIQYRGFINIFTHLAFYCLKRSMSTTVRLWELIGTRYWKKNHIFILNNSADLSRMRQMLVKDITNAVVHCRIFYNLPDPWYQKYVIVYIVKLWGNINADALKCFSNICWKCATTTLKKKMLYRFEHR